MDLKKATTMSFFPPKTHSRTGLGCSNLVLQSANGWFLCFSAVDFFNQINMLYGTITDFCTEESCPVMSAGPKYEPVFHTVGWVHFL